MEIWKDLAEYEGLYQVSNTGIVKSYDRKVSCKSGATRLCKGKILKQFENERGYLCVVLTKDKKSKIAKVHRLVAKTFLDNFDNKPQVNHIDGDKRNNNIGNLEWVTNSENMLHAYAIGLR